MHVSQNGLARAIGVPPKRLNEVLLGKRSISADTVLDRAKGLDTSDKFWTGPQFAAPSRFFRLRDSSCAKY